MKVANTLRVTVTGLITSGLLLLAAASCSFNKKSEPKAADHDTQGSAVQSPSPVDLGLTNQFCAACHYGFDDEKLALSHADAGLGCENCHGESARHRSDEKNITPPDIMWPKDRIIPMCMICHSRRGIDHVAAHKPVLAGAETIFDKVPDQDEYKSCMDCHGETHRVNVRSIRWDKKTGELLKQ